MAFESWDDAMFWHGSLIGYMAGVKSACKDEDKSSLLLRMADTQARLESMEAENAKLRELCKKLYRLADESYVPFKDVNPWMNEFDNAIRAMRELGVEVDE